MFGLGAQSQLGIGIAIHLQNRFSGEARKVVKDLQDLRKAGSATIDSAIRDYRNNAAGIAAMGGAVTFGFYGMAKSVSEFGHKINQVDIIGQGKLGKTKKQLTHFAQEMAREYGQMPKDVANVMLENTRAGVSTGLDIISKYQMATAVATGEPVEAVSKKLLGIQHAYNLSTSEFPRVANAVTAAANASMSSVIGIGEAMQYTAFTAHQYNIPLEKTLALTAKLSQSNIEASSSGVALNNMILMLGTSLGRFATPKQMKMWAALGLDRGQMANMMNSGDIYGVLGSIDKAMTGMTPTDKSSILKNILNIRGTKGAMGAWGSTQPGQSLEDFTAAILTGVKGDLVIKQSKQMMDDPYSQFLKVQAEWENTKIKFIASSAPMLMSVLKGVTKFAKVLGVIADTPIGTIFGGIVGIGVPVVTVLFGLRAAALTATLALRTLSMGPGFSSLMKGGIWNMSMARFAKAGIQGGQHIKMNSAGNPYVGAGGAVNYMGKTYTAGQALPKAMVAGGKMGVGGIFAGLGLSTMGKTMGASVATSVGGKIMPMLSTVGSFMGRLLPIVGWGITLWSIYDVLTGIKGNQEREQRKGFNDPLYSLYSGAMDEEMYKYINPASHKIYETMGTQQYKQESKARLHQQISISIAGDKIYDKAYNQELNNDVNQQLPFNLEQ